MTFRHLINNLRIWKYKLIFYVGQMIYEILKMILLFVSTRARWEDTWMEY